MDRGSVVKFASEMLAYFGYASKSNDVIREQFEIWNSTLEDLWLADDEALAKKYRDQFYTKKVSGPNHVIHEFAKFVIANSQIREDHLDEKKAFSEKKACDACEGRGVVMTQVVSRKTGEINKVAYRCPCNSEDKRFLGLPNATSDILRHASDENKRENQWAREYLQGLGIDPDKPLSFRQMFSALGRIQSIGANVNKKPVAQPASPPVLKESLGEMIRAGGNEVTEWTF